MDVAPQHAPRRADMCARTSMYMLAYIRACPRRSDPAGRAAAEMTPAGDARTVGRRAWANRSAAGARSSRSGRRRHRAPAVRAFAAASSCTTPGCNQSDRAPMAIAASTTAGTSSGLRNTSTMSISMPSAASAARASASDGCTRSPSNAAPASSGLTGTIRLTILSQVSSDFITGPIRFIRKADYRDYPIAFQNLSRNFVSRYRCHLNTCLIPPGSRARRGRPIVKGAWAGGKMSFFNTVKMTLYASLKTVKSPAKPYPTRVTT